MLSKRSLVPRLLAPYVLAVVAVATSLYLYSGQVVENLYDETLSDAVFKQADLAGDLLPWNVGGATLDRHCADVGRRLSARVTVIAPDGTVLGDSDVPSESLENHGHRVEVAQAFANGRGRDTRVSASVKQPLLYCAVRQRRGSEQRVIRLSVSAYTIEQARSRIRRAILVGILAAALAALWPAVVLARRITRRMVRVGKFSDAVARGEIPPPIRAARDDVIGALETSLTGVASHLAQQLRAAREEQRKLAAVLGGMVEGVLVVGSDSTILLSNRVGESLFGLPPFELCAGRPLIELTRNPDLHGLLERVIRGGHPTAHVSEEIRVEAPELRILRISVSSLITERSIPYAFILVCHDVTEMRRLEQVRRDFVANVSHELRTPLASIRGYAETLLTGALEDAANARKFLEIIERHALRLGRLVDDLLTLSDLELGRTELQRGAVELRPAVDRVLEVVRNQAAQAKLSVECDIPGDLPLLDADPDRLEQALLNVIDNAIKYTPASGHVRVSARCVAVERVTFVEITVKDTGIGIPSSDLPRLSERFYRVDKARSRELGGTGLGLAIVKHIVQVHGGSLRIESELNHGTVVFLYFPIYGPSDEFASRIAD